VTTSSPDLFVGDSDSVLANASDPDGDVLAYTWTSTCGRIVGSGATVDLDTAGADPGPCTVTARVTDGFHPPAECAITIGVRERPNVCPTVSLDASETEVCAAADRVVTVTAPASDPDGGPGPLSYEWSMPDGSLLRTDDPRVELDTIQYEARVVTVSVKVSDGDPSCAATASVSVAVSACTPPPEIVLFEPFVFRPGDVGLDAEAKRVLDDVALRFESDPTLRLVVDGHSSKGERSGVAFDREESVRTYLVDEKRIDLRRIIVRSFDDTCPSADPARNRRVEVYIVPEGRSEDEIKKKCSGA